MLSGRTIPIDPTIEEGSGSTEEAALARDGTGIAALSLQQKVRSASLTVRNRQSQSAEAAIVPPQGGAPLCRVKLAVDLEPAVLTERSFRPER